MKKPVTLLSFAFTFTVLSAQITITSADLPQAQYTYVTATDTTPTINNGAPFSSAQAWNFSSLMSDYPSVPTYGITSWTAYASAFPASNIYTYGPAAMYSSLAGGSPVNSQGMNKGYMFWKTDATGFWTVGFRADSGSYSNTNVTLNPFELLIGTPCTYGSAFNNTSRWEFPMNIIPTDVDTYYVSRTVKTLTCDAWGSLTTPTGNFPSVIRVHEYLIKVDSVYAKMGSVVVTSLEILRDTLNNYMYLANGIGYPVSIVHADVNNTVTSVEYYTGTWMSTEQTPGPQQAGLFPNPASNSVTLLLPETSNYTIHINDMTGRTVLTQASAGMDCIKIDVAELPEGVYIVNCCGVNGITGAQRLIIQR